MERRTVVRERPNTDGRTVPTHRSQRARQTIGHSPSTGVQPLRVLSIDGVTIRRGILIIEKTRPDAGASGPSQLAADGVHIQVQLPGQDDTTHRWLIKTTHVAGADPVDGTDMPVERHRFSIRRSMPMWAALTLLGPLTRRSGRP